MSKYHVAEVAGSWFVVKDSSSNPHAKHKYFAGYDFMGSVNWAMIFSFSFALADRAEAEQIVSDLRAAEEDA